MVAFTNQLENLLYFLFVATVMLRAVQQLNQDLQTLDGQYNKLSEHLAKGEVAEHSQEWST